MQCKKCNKELDFPDAVLKQLYKCPFCDSPMLAEGTYTDSRDGKTYKTVKIGNQTWLAENLCYKCDGAYAFDDALTYNWEEEPPKNIDSLEQYGFYYTWEAAIKCAPDGWHLPKVGEWKKLRNFIEHSEQSKVGTSLKSIQMGGQDDYGFRAIPTGMGHAVKKHFSLLYIGALAYFWTASEDWKGCHADSIMLTNVDDELFMSQSDLKDRAYSVRLVKD